MGEGNERLQFHFSEDRHYERSGPRGMGPSYREFPNGTSERDIIQKLHDDAQGMDLLDRHWEVSATTTSAIRYSVWK